MRQLLGVPLIIIALAGCEAPQTRVDPVSDSQWEAAQDSPRRSYPTTIHVAARPAPRPDPARPTNSSLALSKEQVLGIANGQDTQEAIAEIDRHPLAFKLTNENIGWFEDRVAPPELVDYLKKRSAVDWDTLSRSTPAPAAPRPAEMSEPDGGFGYAVPSTPQPDTLPAPAPDTTEYVDTPPPSATVVYEGDYPYYYYGGAIWVWGGYYGQRHWYRNGYSLYSNSPTYYQGARAGVYYGGGAPVAGLYSTNGSVVRTPAPTIVQRTSVRSSRGGFHSGGGHGGHR